MEVYIYIFLYVIIEALIIWIWEWRESERNVFKKKKTISWVKRMVLKMQKRQKRRIRKNKKFARQRRILLSYLRYLKKVKLDEMAAQELLANENELDHHLIAAQECNVHSSKSPTPDAVAVTSLDLDVLKIDSTPTEDLSGDVTQDEPGAGDINDMDSVTDDVKATIGDILTIVCETYNKTAACKTNADEDYPTVEDKTKKVDANETVTVDSKSQPEVVPSEPINRLFLCDSELDTNIQTKPPGPRRLIRWEDFDDVSIDDDVLTGKEGQSWDCEDMFKYNEIHFACKSSLDKDLSEYTTPLIREDTEEDRLRWERACRLADEIKNKRLADQAAQLSKKRKRNKKGNKDNDLSAIAN